MTTSNHPRRLLVLPFALLLLVSCVANATAQEKSSPAKLGEIVAKHAAEVELASTTVTNESVREWQRQVAKLPVVEPKIVLLKGREITVDESMFYSSRYGSPLSYSRALDLAVSAGFEAKAGSRIFDFGYGSIGHLRMFALSGFHAVGVDVAEISKAMYSDASGPLGEGSVQIFDGRFPKDEPLTKQIGEQFDLVLSKNVLKAGYIHPTRAVQNPRMTIDLGVTDEVFVASIFSMLKPGGLFVIYNFCSPKSKPDQPYIPAAEGECPFSKDLFAKAGFEVLNFDVVDDIQARQLARTLGWDNEGGINLETDLFAWFTIVRKPKT